LSLLIDEKILNHVDRWSLQNDLFSHCVSGANQLQEYLDFTTSYHDEDNYITLLNLAQNLYYIYKLTIGERFSEEIRTYAISFWEQYLTVSVGILKNMKNIQMLYCAVL